jgi:hypothetical protein
MPLWAGPASKHPMTRPRPALALTPGAWFKVADERRPRRRPLIDTMLRVCHANSGAKPTLNPVDYPSRR